MSLNQLQAIKANILDRLEELTASPKPNYSIDGQSVSWQAYFDALMNQLKNIDQQINASEPYEEVSQGCS